MGEQTASLSEAVRLIRQLQEKEDALRDTKTSYNSESDPLIEPPAILHEGIPEQIAMPWEALMRIIEERNAGQSPDNVQTSKYNHEGTPEMQDTPMGVEPNVGSAWGAQLEASLEKFRAQQPTNTIDIQPS